jgi:hypothetical protein
MAFLSTIRKKKQKNSKMGLKKLYQKLTRRKKMAKQKEEIKKKDKVDEKDTVNEVNENILRKDSGHLNLTEG